jgi:hypothetical protein
MMRTAKSVFRGVCLRVVLAVAGACSQFPARGQGGEPPVKREEFLRGRFVRDIDIAGVVVDQKGDFLDQVKILVDVAGGGKGHRNIDMLTGLDGAFALRYENTIHCYGFFYKDGYYTEQIRFHPNLPVTGVSKDGDALMGQKDIRVVLEEVGPATQMPRYEMYFEFEINGRWRVLPLVEEKEDGARSLMPIGRSLRVDMAGNTPTNLPPHCLYQRADVADGRIVHADKRVDKKHGGDSDTMLAEQTPARLFLGISGPGNGLQLFEPGDELRQDALGHKVLRAMKEAPEDGYQPEVLLDQTVYNYAVFYIKVGDWYGKGLIPLNTRMYEPTKLDGALIRLWLQPDGSRNVRSLNGTTH